MKILGLFFLVFFLLSCSDEPEKSVPASIMLSSDRSVVLGNGQDEAVLTVVDEQGNDVTAACSFSANDDNLTESKFKTSKTGVFKIKATCRDLISNVIEIKSVDKVEVELKADKNKFLADGTDGITLKLMSNLGEDLTASASFYAGEQPIAGTFFTANTPGNYRITAQYGGLPVNGVIEATGVNTMDFVARILAEDFTSVYCPQCPRVTRLLEMVRKKHPEVVVAAWHSDMSATSKDPMEKKPEAGILRGILGTTSYPKVAIGRERIWDESLAYFDNYPKLPGEVGIALDCRLENGKLQITADIKGVKAFPGAYYTALLLEDGIVYMQMEIYGSVPSFEHNDVVREVFNVTGEAMDIPAGEVVRRTITLPWQETYKKKNCKVVFLVMNKNRTAVNVQTVKIGERVGY